MNGQILIGIGHGIDDNMSDKEEEEYEPILQKMMKIIIFSTVAFIIVTALVIPLFGTMGDYTVTAINDGANISNVQEKYSSQISSMDYGTAKISWKSDGLYLEGSVSSTPVSYKVLDRSDFVSEYPLLMTHPRYGYANTILTYNGTYNVFVSGSGAMSQTNGSVDLAQGDAVYMQDPHGSLVLTKKGVYCNDPDEVVGFGYTYDPQNNTNTFIWSDDTEAITVIKE